MHKSYTPDYLQRSAQSCLHFKKSQNVFFSEPPFNTQQYTEQHKVQIHNGVQQVQDNKYTKIIWQRDSNSGILQRRYVHHFIQSVIQLCTAVLSPIKQMFGLKLKLPVSVSLNLKFCISFSLSFFALILNTYTQSLLITDSQQPFY